MPNGDFEPMYSTNNIWYDTYTTQNLTVHLEDIAADIDTLQTNKANVNHTHTGYALSDHSHSEYALTNHTHNEYALSTHSHSYNDLTNKPDIPTTLPANGGNSDTVDGKHAADFATAESVDMLQTLVGDTSVQSQISTAINAVTPVNIGAAEEDHTHSYNDLTNKPTALPANGGDADTVDGKHASEFATSTSVSALENLVGDSSVQSQIASAIENHTHSYNDLTHKPESLPANGGNADTVDNKHASDFATVESVDMLQTLVGGTSVQSQITAAIDTIEPSDIGAAVSTHTHSYNDLTDKPIIPISPEYESKSFNCNNILSGSLLMKRYGSIITLNSTSLRTGSTPLTSGGTIVTLPEQYRPSMVYRFPIIANTWTGIITIQETGEVEISINSGRINGYSLALFSCTYVI